MKSSLKREADRLFSLFIRNRGARFGMNSCFTCGAYLPIEDLECGHFRPRRYLSTRWHEFNAWPQCFMCNHELSGNLKVYEKKLRGTYGDDAVDGIFILSRTYTNITDDWLKDIIKHYRKVLTQKPS